jgi:peptidoglycan hydrolase-like protein with peptidoglycan-binding domain
MAAVLFEGGRSESAMSVDGGVDSASPAHHAAAGTGGSTLYDLNYTTAVLIATLGAAAGVGGQRLPTRSGGGCPTLRRRLNGCFVLTFKEVSTMHNSVRDYFRDFSAEFEGVVTHMYLDVKSLVTIGIGNRIGAEGAADPAAPAVALPFFFRGNPGAPAAEQDIRDDFGSVGRHPGLSAAGYVPFTQLDLGLADIDQLVVAALVGNESTLKTTPEFSNLDNWPADAQLGLFSLAYATGAGFATGGRFPSFRFACNGQDFSGAAQQSHLDETGNAGLIPRNWADELLFIFASRVLSNSLPIDQRIFPNILTAAGTFIDLGLPATAARWPTLRLNSTGRQVEVLQTLLNVSVTGTFDAATDQAVKSFQAQNTNRDGTPLVADGIVGLATWRALVI